MAEIKTLLKVESTPGVKRDGTDLDGGHYSEATWCRFYRGRPRKMGGFTRAVNLVPGPVRKLLTWAVSGAVNAIAFSQTGVFQIGRAHV